MIVVIPELLKINIWVRKLNNKIILIGGTAGTGKTTLAKEVSNSMNLTHRLGTGFIREILKSYLAKEQFPELYSYTFRPENSENLERDFKEQARLVCKSVNSSIKRAYNEGTSIVIEGNHLLPEYLELSKVSLFVILDCDIVEIKKRIVGSTHSKRVISESDIDNILKIGKIITESAKIHNILVINNEDIKESIEVIKQKCNI